MGWSADDIGDMTGSVALVTGANSGIGYETAAALAEHGAHVVLACRDPERARRAYDTLENDLDRSSLEILPLDLSDLGSVRGAAERFLAENARLDLLINNAGVMGTPYLQSPDGFELQMATNHLGHFALTGLLLDRLLVSGRSRVVTVSSLMHRIGHINLDDVGCRTPGNTWLAYGASKLANLLFTNELSRRLAAMGADTLALAAHPGWTRSNLAGSGAAMGGGRVRSKLARVAGRTLGQSARAGALPTLFAATARGAQQGQFFGPAHLFGLFGPPAVARPNRQARGTERAERLWEASESVTGVRYPMPVPASR
jgi:NAD(P)-dependent dehydrogenase (short-subunit alcohol dehydrogenase family)